MPKLKYIIDQFFINKNDIIYDTAEDGKKSMPSSFTAVVQEVGIKNKNKRLYTEEAIDEALAEIQPRINEGAIYAYVNHPNYQLLATRGTDLQEIGAIINEAVKETDATGKKVVKVRGTFVKNDAFYNGINAVLEAGGRVGASARGYVLSEKSVKYDKKTDTYIYGKGYRLDGWDFVTDPAADAKILSYENVENKSEEEVIMFKTVEELRATYPELVGVLDEAAKKANDAVTNMNKTNDELVKKNAELQSEVKMVKDSLIKAEAELVSIKMEKEISSLLKGHKYADFIVVPKNITTVEDAKSYIESETARLEKFESTLKTAPAPKTDAITPIPPKAPKTDMTEHDSQLAADIKMYKSMLTGK